MLLLLEAAYTFSLGKMMMLLAHYHSLQLFLFLLQCIKWFDTRKVQVYYLPAARGKNGFSQIFWHCS